MAAQSTKHHNLKSLLQDIKARPCDLPLQFLTDITDNFSAERVIGRGGFGVVYKGVDNGEIVAVKKLVSMPGITDIQFENEVHHLIMLKHQNIVRFLGYCSETRQVCMEHDGTYRLVEKQERLLCLEYMPNGSLKQHISDASHGFDWHERYKIIKGICCGLHYLHEARETKTPILHLDLKPANILLTNDMVPKITDFGTSRLFGKQQSQAYTRRMMGTMGYMAWEYVDKGIISKKSDIFSLGVIIIEIITGRRDDPESIGTSTHDFVESVLEKWTNRLKDLRCTSVEKDLQQIKRCIEIGLRCKHIDATKRPTAKQIIESLNRWDNMSLHVIFKEWSHTDQVLENCSKASQPGIFPHTVLQSDQMFLNAESPSRHNVPVEDGPSDSFPEVQPEHAFPSSGLRTCAGCENQIGLRRFLSYRNLFWHFRCFRCFFCDKPLYESEFVARDAKLYHRLCCKGLFHPKCDVCNNFIPRNRNGVIEYRVHPFWKQKYCPSHEDDGTSRCCSCERMEHTGIKYISLDDERTICLECLDTAIMESSGCQHLYMDVQAFFDSLNIKIEQHIPLLLVEKKVMNEAMGAEKNGYHHPETRGLCLYEEGIVRIIIRRPSIGQGNRIIDIITEPYKVSRQCEVSAILILFGLPRLLTGSILAHEMMHAYLRVKGYRVLNPEVEEGICQVLSHMWLESEIATGSSANVASSSAASSYLAPTYSKKSTNREFEKKLGAFFKRQIERDYSVAYGDGFREGDWAVTLYGLRSTLDYIKMKGSFPEQETLEHFEEGAGLAEGEKEGEEMDKV